ncbi:SLC13 family permease [Paenibacillus sp. SC116]|uniref:SLC13 family permease n=1 Tax=Paenibacillus sp. SC116 TaxID=2968986 RepID=UPI00215AC2FB|nr:SLC13 family permease [Paenibacillus sp. SC116]MCR8845185.1 SLC13 family permease [Paenibacillus sp. SC116]
MDPELTRQTSSPQGWRARIAKLSNSRIFSTIAIAASILLIAFVDGLPYEAKVTAFFFLLAMGLWIGSSLPAGYVALGAVIAIVLFRGAEASLLYESFAEEVVWLMVGAFIIGEAVRESGLASRFTRAVVRRARHSGHVMTLLTLALQVVSFFIPSTSGRAALSMPIVKEISALLHSKREKQTLAMLVPIMILMSTSATLIGAGAHVIGIGILEKTSGQTISYVQWFIWGVPFVLVICAISLLVLQKLYGSKELLQPLAEPARSIEADHAVASNASSLTVMEKKTLWMTGGLIVAWMTESLHGYDLAFITMIGALLFMTPQWGVLSWKQGIKSVSWSLIVFVAAATALGKGLVETGVVSWIQQRLFRFLDVLQHVPDFVILLTVLIITVTSHLYITSHTTRAVVMIPGLIVFGQSLGLNETAIVFLSLVAMNYCVTFPVSSKALLLFYEDEEVAYDAKDLLKLSMIMLPIYVLVMIVFYYTYWNWTGLSL